MSQEPVRVDLPGSVATITLDRPEARNALDRPLLRALGSALRDLDARPGLRAVVLTGAGDRAFCAGADLRERATMSDEETRGFLALLGEAVALLEGLPVPVVAALNGATLGGGLELALGCDLRVASEEAVLGLPEVGVGIIPGAGGTQRLPRLVGLARAKEMVLTGRKLTAGVAESWGLVNRVVPAAQVLGAAHALAQEVADKAPLAVAAAKRALDGGWGRPLPEGLAWESACYGSLLGTRDRREGLEAFAQKRLPRWSGE
jgi:enoyl-CoA hydratase/carnithine racemase